MLMLLYILDASLGDYLSLSLDVCDNDIDVSVGMVPLFHCVLMGLFWRPQKDSSFDGHHSPTVCKILYILQPLHLCCCQQEVSSV